MLTVRALVAAVAAVAVAGLLTGCTTPGDPTSPDPLRFVLEGEPEACRIVFGPLTPDMDRDQTEEVGQIDTPDGPTFLRRGLHIGDLLPSPLVINGIDVHVEVRDDTVYAGWLLPPKAMGFSTRSLDEATVRELLPTLVMSADVAGLAQTLVDHIEGARIAFAGMAPSYDLGVGYEDASLTVSGRGVDPPRLAAYLAVLEPAIPGVQTSDATVVIGSRTPSPSSNDDFTALLSDQLGNGDATVAISDGHVRTSVGARCEPALAPDALPGAAVTGVAIAESDVGDVLRITFDGLPPDTADEQLIHLTMGSVELVAVYNGGPTVDFPAALSHAESRLLQERLSG